jgi:hypothetical protein
VVVVVVIDGLRMSGAMQCKQSNTSPTGASRVGIAVSSAMRRGRVVCAVASMALYAVAISQVEEARRRLPMDHSQLRQERWSRKTSRATC